MICPVCGSKSNLPGADWCEWCQFDLSAIDRPAPSDRVERSLMTEPVRVLAPREPVMVRESANLDEAVRTMMERKVGAVLVTNPEGQLTGILTERDFLTKVAGSPEYHTLLVRDFMTAKPETVTAEDSLAFALAKMAGGGYRHLPVIDKGRPIGVVSVRDMLRHITQLCQDA